MVIIAEPSFELLSNVPSAPESELFQQIERAGRTCYKSEDKITAESAMPFVKMIIDRGHESVIEHSNIILRITPDLYDKILSKIHSGDGGVPCFLRFSDDRNGILISGNIRSFRSFHRFFGVMYDDLRVIGNYLSRKYPLAFANLPNLDETVLEGIELITDVSKFSRLEMLRHLCVTVKMVCDRGVSHEIVRNKQEITFSQESTRYCERVPCRQIEGAPVK